MGRQQPSQRTKPSSRGPRRLHKATAAASDRGALARPLDTLVFLLPWVLFYQIALLVLPPRAAVPGRDQVVAIDLLMLFFELFGTTAVIMPGLAIVVILLCTHVASQEPWKVDRRAVAWMYVESVVLAMPLVLLSLLIQGSHPFAATTQTAGYPWITEITLYIGAGIFEELLFRLVLISVLVIIAADLLRLPSRTTIWAAVLLAAGLFAAHHYAPIGSDPFVWSGFAFRTMAGVYLGTVFVYRGYGPAAGLHIAYNLLAFAVAPR